MKYRLVVPFLFLTASRIAGLDTVPRQPQDSLLRTAPIDPAHTVINYSLLIITGCLLVITFAIIAIVRRLYRPNRE